MLWTLQELKIVTSFAQVDRRAGGSSPSQVTRAQLTTDEQMAYLAGEDGKASSNALKPPKAAADIWEDKPGVAVCS